jgi:hypothetical protein
LPSAAPDVTLAGVVTWSELAKRRPDLAAAGRSLLYQYGVGLAFLATVRADGGPRVHPFCPLLADRGLFAWVIPSPKRADLRRDGRYALHSFPCESNEDAFYVTGAVRTVADGDLAGEMSAQFLAERGLPGSSEALRGQELFELLVESCLLTTTTGHGDPAPSHVTWRAP